MIREIEMSMAKTVGPLVGDKLYCWALTLDRMGLSELVEEHFHFYCFPQGGFWAIEALLRRANEEGRITRERIEEFKSRANRLAQQVEERRGGLYAE